MRKLIKRLKNIDVEYFLSSSIFEPSSINSYISHDMINLLYTTISYISFQIQIALEYNAIVFAPTKVIPFLRLAPVCITVNASEQVSIRFMIIDQAVE